MNAIKVNDQVVVSSASYVGVWTVKKVNPTTYVLEQAGQRNLRASHEYVRLATEQEQLDAKTGATVTMVPVASYFEEGEVVRSDNAKLKGKLFVVLSHRKNVKIAQLGGGEIWTVDAALLTKVELSPAWLS